MSNTLSEDKNNHELLKSFKESWFGFQPKTEEEWKVFSAIENTLNKHKDTWGVDYLYRLANQFVDDFWKDNDFNCKSSEGLYIEHFNWENYVSDYKNNTKYLLGVYEDSRAVEDSDREPLFYYQINAEDTNIKIDVNRLDDYRFVTLTGAFALSLPTVKTPNCTDIDLTVECALYSLNHINRKSISEELKENSLFGKSSLVSGYLAEYIYSTIDKYLEKFDKENFDINTLKDGEEFFKNASLDIKNQIKSDLYSKPDSQSECMQNLKQSLKELFNDKSEYGYDDIYKYSHTLENPRWSLFIDRLSDSLATDVYMRFIGGTSIDSYEYEPKLYKIKYLNKVNDFLMDTTVGDLIDYGIDLKHEKLKDGIPLLPLIAEFSKDIGIKFNKDVNIPKLSDLVKSADIER